MSSWLWFEWWTNAPAVELSCDWGRVSVVCVWVAVAIVNGSVDHRIKTRNEEVRVPAESFVYSAR